MTDSVARIETHGVDTIPDSERTGRPRDVIAILIGSNLALGVVIFGWLPTTYGLSFWESLSAQVLGTVAGIALVAPLSLVSWRTGTNLSTSSGAQFGVRGRLIGSAIGLALSLGYAALTIWTGGAAVVEPLSRLFGLPSGPVSYLITYTLLTIVAVVVAVIGYRLLATAGAWLSVGMTLLVIAGVFAFAGTFDPTPIGDGGYLLGGFWPTWLLAFVATGISGPVAFITLLGDYTRYISPSRFGGRKVVVATVIGLLFGLLIPQLFGMFTSYAVRAGDDYVASLVAAAPLWFLPLLMLNGIFGSIGNAGILLYSMGLDLDAILPRLSRVLTTVLASAGALILVIAGYFLWDASDAVTAFVLLLTAVGTPWAVITLIGYVRLRGGYDPDALQVFNRRSRGGIYWYRGGWSLEATLSWALGASIGILSVDTTVYRGPIVNAIGGIDASPILAGVVAGAAYLLLTRRQQRHLETAALDPSSTKGLS